MLYAVLYCGAYYCVMSFKLQLLWCCYDNDSDNDSDNDNDNDNKISLNRNHFSNYITTSNIIITIVWYN